MFRLYLKNTILSPSMVFAVVGLYLSMLVSGWPLGNSDLLYNFQETISLGFTAFFIPVVSVIPICYFQYSLLNGKTLHYYLIRTKKKNYFFGACGGAVLSGVVVMVFAFILFSITCLIYSPMGPPHIGDGLFPNNSLFYTELAKYPILSYLLNGFVFAMNGTIWPMLSLMCFSLTSNRYVVMALPFVVRTIMGYFAQSWQIYVLDPAQLLLKGIAREWIGGGIPYLLLYIGCFITIAAGVFLFFE